MVLPAAGVLWEELHLAWGGHSLWPPHPEKGCSFRWACCPSSGFSYRRCDLDLDLEQGWEPMEGCRLAWSSCLQRWASQVDRGYLHVRGHGPPTRKSVLTHRLGLYHGAGHMVLAEKQAWGLCHIPVSPKSLREFLKAFLS